MLQARQQCRSSRGLYKRSNDLWECMAGVLGYDSSPILFFKSLVVLFFDVLHFMSESS